MDIATQSQLLVVFGGGQCASVAHWDLELEVGAASFSSSSELTFLPAAASQLRSAQLSSPFFAHSANFNRLTLTSW